METILTKLKNFKLKSPEEVFKVFGEWFDSNKKTAFIMALVIGFITHAVLLSVIIMTPDGLWNSIVYSAGLVETQSGRWGINVIDTLRKNLAFPSITTVFSIIITAVNAIFIVDLLNLKSKISSVVTGTFLAVSPCLTMTLLYPYTADAYCFSFLFATLAAWCIYREKHRVAGGIFGAIFTMFTLSLYQGYLGAIVALCVLKPIIDILKGDKKYKQIFINIGISILIVIVGIGLYWVSEQIALNIYNTKLSTYRGANEVGILNSLKNIKGSVKSIYNAFWEFFFGGNIVNNGNMSRHTFYKILFITEAIALALILILRKTETLKQKIIDAALVLAMVAILPLAFNCIGIIVPNTIFYPLNMAHIIVVIPFMMAILENFEISKGAILKWVSLSMCLIIAVTYFLAANATYMGIRMKYNQAYSMTVRMVDRIENSEGYDGNKPWMIVGIIDERNTRPVSEIYFLTLGGVANTSVFHGNYIGSIETWKRFLQTFLGIQPTFASPEVYYKVCGTQEFRDMPIFPETGSVREIDGVMVVKLTNDVPM